MKPVPLAACTVVALLGLYVGTYFGASNLTVLWGVYVRDFGKGVPFKSREQMECNNAFWDRATRPSNGSPCT